MVSLIAMLLAAAPVLPPECEPPEVRDVAPLSKLSKLDGTLSVGLDSVATWCFDSAGTWTAGLKPKQGQAPKDSEPLGECKKAVQSCESAQAALLGAIEWRALERQALADFDRPYRGQKYAPKRSGLRETPNEAADCGKRVRSELFAMAQARMDVARLVSLVQAEYANYKTWLYKSGLECRNEVLAARKDPTRMGVAVDKPNAPVLAGAKPALTPAEPAESAAPDAGPTAAERAAAEKARAVAIALPVAVAPEPVAVAPVAPAGAAHDTSELDAMLARWKAFAARQAEHEKDRDYTLGFLASRELRNCRCSRVNAAAVVRALENKEGGEAGLSLLRSDDVANTRCTECGLDAFGPWRSRASKQCTLVDGLTDYEISRLSASDDANGIPPRCFEDVLRVRAAKAGPGDGGRAALVALPPQVTGSTRPMAAAQPVPGTQPAAGTRPAVAPQPGVVPQPGVGAQPGVGTQQPAGTSVASAGQAVPGGGAYGPAMTGPGVGPGYDPYLAPSAPAPAMPREDGRMYVRLSMSATCTAEIMPGPIQARTGDLLLVPFAARQLMVKSPCGGLAEIYWGREARPRFSEVFGRNQPLVFNFKAQ